MTNMTIQKSIRYLVLFLGCFFTLYHFYFGYFSTPGAMSLRITHVCIALMLGYILYPASKNIVSSLGKSLDIVFRVVAVIASLLVFVYVVRDADAFQMHTGYLEPADMVLGTFLVILVLEATRRTVGWAMAILAFLLMLQALFAGSLPGVFGGSSISWEEFIDTNFVQTAGILGIPVAVTAGYVVLFLFFGVLLLKTGVGELLMDVATALTGRYAGGPAKAAVVSSAFMGTMSGSVIANVVTTGSITIPLMKRCGYKPELAGAIEAASSTGGVIMPPVMGAAAFILALFVGVPYKEVMIAAAIPSILYFLSIFCTVHFEAKKAGLRTFEESEIPRLWPTLKSRGYMLLPVVIITALLLVGYTPTVSAFYGTISVIALSWVRKDTRLTLRGFIECLEETASASVPVVVACAGAGIIIGSVMLSGIGLRVSSLIFELSHGSLFLSLLLTAVAAIILGMGMTTTAVYVTLAALIVEGLVRTGVEPLAAHLFILYFGVVSYVTPPVALGAFAAAGVARTKPGKTAWVAFRVAAAAFIVPFMFVYGPQLLLIGDPIEVAMACVTAGIGVVCLAAGLSGWLLTRLGWLARGGVLIASICLMYPGSYTDLVGLLLAGVVLASQYWGRNSRTKLNGAI